MFNNIWENIVENIWSIISILIGVVATLLSLFNQLSLLLMITLILSLVTTFMISEIYERNKTRKMLSKIQYSLFTSVIPSLGGVETSNFEDRRHLYQYLNKRIYEAKKSWDILQFGPFHSDGDNYPEKKKYHKAIQYALKHQDIIIRRAVAVWDEPHLKYLKTRFLEYIDLNYHVSFFHKLNPIIPLLNMIIIDNIEVVIFTFFDHTFHNTNVGSFCIRHKLFSELCTRYFENIWTSNSTKRVKERSIHWEVVNEFEEVLKRDSFRNLKNNL